MNCSYCSEPIEETEAFCKAGPDDAVFCSKICAYQSFKKFYSKDELNNTLKIISQVY